MPEAAAVPLAESLLVESVAAPAALEGMSLAGAEFGVPSLFGGSSGLGALGGAAGELGGLGGLLGGGVSSAGTGLGAGALQGGLGSIAPEAFAQTQAALQATIPGANQIASATGQLPFEISPAELQAAQGVVSEAAPAATSSYFPQPVSPIPGYATEPAVDAISNVAQYPLGSSAERQALFGNTEGAYGLQGYDNRFAPLENPSGGGIMDMVKNGLGSVGKFIEDNPKTSAAAAGLGGYLLGQKKNAGVPEAQHYNGPLSKFHYNPSSYTPTIAQPPTNPYRAQYTSYAKGGIADLGGYSDGGQMLKGPGDGMSDSIPANIANKQPARLANEEFVIPADVVSHLGNGSSDAGAKQLYSMMDRVRKARTGTKKQGRQISPNKYMPA
jgi:hypothetical protein